MRIVVISDSHGSQRAIDKILSEEKSAKYVFFLGDGERDIEDFPLLYPEKIFKVVCGNCDFGSLLMSSGIEKINGVGIFYAHGHVFGVKHGTERFLNAAKKAGCKIALYGHTHISESLYEDGIWLVNPGSCSAAQSRKPTYAVIDIEENGILPTIKEL